MRHATPLRSAAIIMLMTVTAMSLTNILARRIATPLILFAMSVLFFVMAYEGIKADRPKKSRKFIILSIILLISAIIVFFMGQTL